MAPPPVRVADDDDVGRDWFPWLLVVADVLDGWPSSDGVSGNSRCKKVRRGDWSNLGLVSSLK